MYVFLDFTFESIQQFFFLNVTFRTPSVPIHNSFVVDNTSIVFMNCDNIEARRIATSTTYFICSLLA